MRDYVVGTWGTWDDLAQEVKCRDQFTPGADRIVRVGREDVGLLKVEEEPEYLWLVKLYLLKDFRRRGIGSAVLSSVVERAHDLGKAVRLRVLRVNTDAQRFYARHGFTVVDEEPERLFMVKRRT